MNTIEEDEEVFYDEKEAKMKDLNEQDHISYYLRKIASSFAVFGNACNLGFGLWFIVLFAIGNDTDIEMLREANLGVTIGIGVGTWLLIGAAICIFAVIRQQMHHWVRGLILLIVGAPPLGFLYKVPLALFGPLLLTTGGLLYLALSYRARKKEADNIPLAPVKDAKTYSTHNPGYE